MESRIWMTKRAAELDGKCSVFYSPAVCCVDCILFWHTLWGADFQYELVNAIQYSRMLSLYEPFYDDFPIKTLFFINNLIYNIYIFFPKMIFEIFKNIILIFLRNRNKSLVSYTVLLPTRAWCPLLLRQIIARVPIREFTVYMGRFLTVRAFLNSHGLTCSEQCWKINKQLGMIRLPSIGF